MKVSTVGVVGYGAMGSIWVERLRRAGLETIVYDYSGSAKAVAEAAGIECATSAAALASACDVVCVLVRTEDQVSSVIVGTEGILQGAMSGGTLILHSTVRPATVQSISDVAATFGVCVIDAPIIGNPTSVRAGKGAVLVGGPIELIPQSRELLLHIVDSVVHTGTIGTASTVKLMRNVLGGCERFILREILRLGAVSGLDVVQSLGVLQILSLNQTPVLDRWDELFEQVDESWQLSDSPSLHMFTKDIMLATEHARGLGLELSLLEKLSALATEIAP